MNRGNVHSRDTLKRNGVPVCMTSQRNGRKNIRSSR